MFFTMVICEVLFMIAALVVQGLVMNRFGETNPDTRRWIMLATMFALTGLSMLTGLYFLEEIKAHPTSLMWALGIMLTGMIVGMIVLIRRDMKAQNISLKEWMAQEY